MLVIEVSEGALLDLIRSNVWTKHTCLKTDLVIKLINTIIIQTFHCFIENSVWVCDPCVVYEVFSACDTFDQYDPFEAFDVTNERIKSMCCLCSWCSHDVVESFWTPGNEKRITSRVPLACTECFAFFVPQQEPRTLDVLYWNLQRVCRHDWAFVRLGIFAAQRSVFPMFSLCFFLLFFSFCNALFFFADPETSRYIRQHTCGRPTWRFPGCKARFAARSDAQFLRTWIPVRYAVLQKK